MPAIITHNQFGLDVLRNASVKNEELYTQLAPTKEARAAFLLGNQGPDPLFFCVLNPALLAYADLGGQMHAKQPAALISAMAATPKTVSSEAAPIARSYAAGFLCHYLLDTTAHPFIYSQQYALCDAGVEGLSRKDGHEVHAVIESELDEVVLYTRMGKTIAEFAPQREILQATEETLAIISHQIQHVSGLVYGRYVNNTLFAKSVHCYRFAQAVLHSPTGKKRAALGRAERVVRRHSFVQAMSWRNCKLEESPFENNSHAVWENPFIHTVHTESFSDLFSSALQKAAAVLPEFCTGEFSEESARAINNGYNFSGDIAKK